MSGNQRMAETVPYEVDHGITGQRPTRQAKNVPHGFRVPTELAIPAATIGTSSGTGSPDPVRIRTTMIPK